MRAMVAEGKMDLVIANIAEVKGEGAQITSLTLVNDARKRADRAFL